MNIPKWFAWVITAGAVALAAAQLIWLNDNRIVSVVSVTAAALVVGFLLGGGPPIEADDPADGEHERIELPAPGDPKATDTVTPSAALHPGTPGDSTPKQH